MNERGWSAFKLVKNVHGNTMDQLGEAIVSGRYATGASLPPEPLLGEELGVSRTVVREAIKSLCAKGLVTTGPKVGTRVQSQEHWNWFDADVVAWQSSVGITEEFLRDLQDLRRIVEPAAVRLAAERATAQDLAELEQAFAGMMLAVDGHGDYVQQDLRFHQGLLRAGHNRLLEHMSRALAALLTTSFELSTKLQEATRHSLPLHRAVLDAIIARNPRRAEKAILLLIDDAHEDIEAMLRSRERRAAKTTRSHPARRVLVERLSG